MRTFSIAVILLAIFSFASASSAQTPDEEVMLRGHTCHLAGVFMDVPGASLGCAWGNDHVRAGFQIGAFHQLPPADRFSLVVETLAQLNLRVGHARIEAMIGYGLHFVSNSGSIRSVVLFELVTRPMGFLMETLVDFYPTGWEITGSNRFNDDQYELEIRAGPTFSLLQPRPMTFIPWISALMEDSRDSTRWQARFGMYAIFPL